MGIKALIIKNRKIMKDKNRNVKIDIEHIAELSNLKLSTDEVNIFRLQLGEIINYIDELNEINTESTEPTSQTSGLVNIKRQDKVKSSLTQSEAISQKDDTYNGYFVVPMILENKKI